MDEAVKGKSARNLQAYAKWWPLLIPISLAIVVLLALRPPPVGPVENFIGQPLPPLAAGGWLNTQYAVKTEDLAGEVVLLDCWASWCGPCIANMPDLIRFYQDYSKKGLVLVGLTPEARSELSGLKRFMRRMREIEWPIGYDAEHTIVDVMGVGAYPTLILYDRAGRAVWAGHGLDGLKEAADRALGEG